MSDINSTIPFLSNVFIPSLNFRFWILLFGEIPSLACYIFALIYILIHKTQREALHNHCIILFLILGLGFVLVDVPSMLNSVLHGGQVYPASGLFCQVWWVVEIGFFNTITLVLCWSSFERHILIFHSNLIATQWQKIFLHYMPIAILVVYSMSFHIYAVFWPPCVNVYDFTKPTCGAYPCFFAVPFLTNWMVVGIMIIPVLLITMFNVALLVRFVWQKTRLNQHPNWKRYRKMAFQLLSISSVYLLIELPFSTIGLVRNIGSPFWANDVQLYLYFFNYLVIFFLPFLCLASLPDVWSKLKTFLVRRHRRVIPVI